MSNLEYVVRQLCESEYSKELILENNSQILAYSILSRRPIEEIGHINPEEELTISQLDDFQAIKNIIQKIKNDLINFDTIL